MQEALSSLQATIDGADAALEAVSLPDFDFSGMTSLIETLKSGLDLAESLAERAKISIKEVVRMTDCETRYLTHQIRTVQTARQSPSTQSIVMPDGKPPINTPYVPVYGSAYIDAEYAKDKKL